MTRFARITLLVVAATILSSTIKAQNYSPRCNATLSLFNADPAVSSCFILQSLFTTTRDDYTTAGYNFSATQHNIDYACGPTSPVAACTSSVIEKVQTGLNSDCANDTLHAGPSSSLYQLRLRINSASLFQQMLCSQEGGMYCMADFLQTYVKWPLTYETGVAAEIGVLGNAVGNITSTLSTESSFITCSACSSREYSAVFAVVANILRHSSTISTTAVGLPGPTGPSPLEKASLDYIDLLNTTMSKQCNRPFLTYKVAVPPPPPPASSSSSPSPSGNRTTSRNVSKSDSVTSVTATATQPSDANNTVSATATGKSAAAGLHSSVLSVVLAGGIAFLAALLL